VRCPDCGGPLVHIGGREYGCFRCGYKWILEAHSIDGGNFDADELGLDPEEEFDA
jgi:hypothetical protein